MPSNISSVLIRLGGALLALPFLAVPAAPLFAQPEADLSITAVADRDAAVRGRTLLYTVTVSNVGPNQAPSTDITLALPPDTTFLASSGCVGDPAASTICHLQSIDQGQSKQATFLVTVRESAAGSLRFEASVDSSFTDPNPANDEVVLSMGLSTESIAARGSRPTIAADPTSSGLFTLAWEAPPAFGPAGAGIKARLFDATGMPVGVELRLDQSGAGPTRPDVARRGDGEFVAVWQGQDTDGEGVFARLFSATGMPVGVELRLNTSEDLTQALPTVAGFGDGRYAAAWSDEENLGGFVRSLRLFDATGMPVGIELRFGESDIQSKPPAIAVSSRRILVTWEDAADRVAAQLFDLTGMPVGVEFQVAPDAGAAYPQVAKHPDGGFVVVWQDDNADHGTGILGRRLDLTGMPVGVEFRVNSQTAGDQLRPAIAAAPDGTYAVTWQGPDGPHGDGVFARRLDLTGMPVGIEQRLSPGDAGSATSVEPAFVDSDGTFYVAWQSDENGNEVVITPQSVLFSDDFESGDLSAWSSRTP